MRASSRIPGWPSTVVAATASRSSIRPSSAIEYVEIVPSPKFVTNAYRPSRLTTAQQTSLRVLPTGPAAVQPVFAAALAAQRRRETAAGVSLVGPHRDDVSILLNGAAASAFGSRAQVRPIALA